MRIIAGAYKGLKLYTDKKSPVRPTDDFTREMLFNILQPIKPGALVLDLYGGTGAVALEFLSRCKEKKRLRKRVFGANGSTCAPRAKIATGACLSPARSVFLRGGRVCACIFDRVQGKSPLAELLSGVNGFSTLTTLFGGRLTRSRYGMRPLRANSRSVPVHAAKPYFNGRRPISLFFIRSVL
jgi:hypothetical protein